jgi:hypothetical protein
MQIDTFLQRYPPSPIYKNKIHVSIAGVRNVVWKWIGPTILSVCLFIPILALLTEIVREREFFMKDLLEISGLMNPSYWLSYVVTILVLGQISM